MKTKNFAPVWILKPLVSGLILIALLLSCNSGEFTKPSVTGRIGEIAIVIEPHQWDGELGDTLRASLSSPYPMLPQDEKAFNLLNMSSNAFNPSLQRHRNLLVTKIGSEYANAELQVKPDQWAKPQTLVYLTGPDQASIAKLVGEKKQFILDLYELAERKRLASSASENENEEIAKTIQSTLKVSMHIPKEYHVMVKRDDFIWIESRTSHVNKGIFIYTYPFTNDSTFTSTFLINKRNELLKANVPGTLDGSWMTTSSYIEPLFSIKRLKDQVYGEMRGLWEVENDFMGGPFISRTYVDKVNKQIVTVEGYIYAPKFDKRDYLRKVDGIIYSLKLAGDTTEVVKNEVVVSPNL